MVPEDLVAACVRHRLPLFAVTEDVAFATITEHVVRQVSTERAGDLAAVVERHRRLMSSGPAGGGPDVVLDLLGSDLDLPAWVLSPTGRQVAGPSDGPALPHAVAARLAGAHMAAVRGGRRGPYRTVEDQVAYSLFPVRGRVRDPRETVLSDWLLAVAADTADWPAERLDLLHGVTQLITVERDRRDAARTVRRRLAQEVLELVQTGAPPAEVAARLRVAAPVLLPGLGAAPHWQVIVARVEWESADPSAGLDGGAIAQSLLEELLVDPGTAEPDGADRIAVATADGEAVALVPLPADGEGGGGEAPLAGRSDAAPDADTGPARRARPRRPAGRSRRTAHPGRRAPCRYGERAERDRHPDRARQPPAQRLGAERLAPGRSARGRPGGRVRERRFGRPGRVRGARRSVRGCRRGPG